ncbi:MAG: tetraacyldisaccharide 4'-kinase, partial [Thiovulaceae bacterium]|nr:tetraacyldisaccharide 4'-kinase [Sulfurimonadaceae bacterium]
MIPRSLIAWGERFLFAPSFFQKIFSSLLLPLSALYCLIVYRKYKSALKNIFLPKVPVISIGNLIMGGSGKTPVTIALAKQHEHSAIVLRGYGRASSGTIVVSDGEKILVDVSTS